MNDVVIRIKDAVVSYREDVALRGVSLEVRRGEFIGVIGPNGAGKTTLLTIINGLGKLIHGQAQVLGLLVNGRNGNILRRRIGYVSQVQNIDPRLPITVRETVAVGCYGRLGLFHHLTREQWQKVDRVLEMVGLSSLAKRPFGHLSGGEQQKVAIARALIQEPEIFLLDEPTASLDWKAQGEILNLVRTIHDAYQMTTLFVTHDLNVLPRTCHRVVLMKEGKIWGAGDIKLMLKSEILTQLYSTPVTVIDKAGRTLVSS